MDTLCKEGCPTFASDQNTSDSSCLKQQPEFAELCSFIHHFGPDLGIYLTFPQLVQYLTFDERVNWKKWETIHVKLLNQLKYRARSERWEPVLGRFLQIHGHQLDGLSEAARQLLKGTVAVPSERVPPLAYYGLSLLDRTRVLLVLFETQFERNLAFKEKINLRSAIDLRFRPLGWDVWGRIYWLLKDSELNVLLYREDTKDNVIQLVCESTEEIRLLYKSLRDVCTDGSKLSTILATYNRSDRDKAVLKPITEAHHSTSHSPVEELTFGNETMPNSPRPQLDVVTSYESRCSPPPTSMAALGCVTQTCAERDGILLRLESLNSGHVNVESKSPVPDSVNEFNRLESDHVTSKKKNEITTSLKSESPVYSISAVKAEPTHDPVCSEHCDIATTVTKTNRKRGLKYGNVLDESAPSVTVRRSGRQRKPVVFLTMEPMQSKRPRPVTTQASQKLLATVLQTKASSKIRSKHRHTAEPLIGSDCKVKISKQNKRNKKKRKRRCKGLTYLDPWTNPSSSSESDDEDDTFEQALMEHTNYSDSDWESGCSHKRKDDCDWLGKPESDLELDDLSDDSVTDSLTQGRNLARQKRMQRLGSHDIGHISADAVESEEQCQICSGADQPEWLLLCDRCDLGHHAKCLCPPLFLIPEGDWFCPRCQHASLLTALTECVDLLEAEQKKQTMWKRMQERLNYVNISMTNILADDEDDDGGVTGGGRRTRNDSIIYKESESESQFSSCSVNTREGSQMLNSNDTDVHVHGRRSHKTKCTRMHVRPNSTARKLRSNGGLMSQCSVKKSEDEVEENVGSSGDSSTYVSRATRRKVALYNMNDAFKQLDEALQEDEKYQEEKLRRKNRKLISSETLQDEVISDQSIGRSIGKDLSYILGPNWKECDTEKSRSKRRRRRLGTWFYSSDESDSANSTHHHSSDEDDTDFKLSSTSESSSVSERIDHVASESDNSNESSLCTSRRVVVRSRKKVQRTGYYRRLRSTMYRTKRPLPRFESNSEDETAVVPILERPRRRRTVVCYRESASEDDNSILPASKYPQRQVKLNEEQSDNSGHVESNDVDELSALSALLPCHISMVKRRRLLISSSNSDGNSEKSEEERLNGECAQNFNVNTCYWDPNIACDENPDSDYLSSRLEIVESSPERYVVASASSPNETATSIH